MIAYKKAPQSITSASHKCTATLYIGNDVMCDVPNYVVYESALSAKPRALSAMHFVPIIPFSAFFSVVYHRGCKYR